MTTFYVPIPSLVSSGDSRQPSLLRYGKFDMCTSSSQGYWKCPLYGLVNVWLYGVIAIE